MIRYDIPRRKMENCSLTQIECSWHFTHLLAELDDKLKDHVSINEKGADWVTSITSPMTTSTTIYRIWRGVLFLVSRKLLCYIFVCWLWESNSKCLTVILLDTLLKRSSLTSKCIFVCVSGQKINSLRNIQGRSKSCH